MCRRQLHKIIITMISISLLTNVSAGFKFNCDKKAFSDNDNKQLAASDFEKVSFAGILPREDQSGKKVIDPAGSQKIVLLATSGLSAKYINYHVNYPETLYGSTDDYSLVSLHCLLTI